MRKVKRRTPIAEIALLDAAKAYITEHGGSAVVLGPTVVIHMPDDNAQSYYLAVKFMGRKPTIAHASRQEKEPR